MTIPKYTCKDRSAIDYFICSPNMTKYLHVFNVLEFSSLFSDSHCGIELKIDVQYVASNEIKHGDCSFTEKVISWNCDKASSFERNCNNESLQAIIQKLDSMANKNIQTSDIDSVVKDIETLLESACVVFVFKLLEYEK